MEEKKKKRLNSKCVNLHHACIKYLKRAIGNDKERGPVRTVNREECTPKCRTHLAARPTCVTAQH